ncbi:MAG: RHS repeat-associated core domain-containing protein [Anaeromyxobacter sp.]
MKVVADTGTATGKVRQDVRYAFDLANRLVSVTRTVGESEVLDYGPDGELLRRRITTGSTSKDVFYVGEYATATASNCTSTCIAAANTVTVDAHVIYAGTRIASARAASLDAQSTARTLYYYRTRLGSVIGTSKRGGSAGTFYRYTPYGEVDLTNETDANRSELGSELGYANALRLTGGLLHLVHRAYDTESKVFVQSDVVDRLRYAYAGGDPINRSDPTGLRWAVSTNDMAAGRFWDGGNPFASDSADKSPGGSSARGSVKPQQRAATQTPAAQAEKPKPTREGTAVSSETSKLDHKAEKSEANRNGERLIAALDAARQDPFAARVLEQARGRVAFTLGDIHSEGTLAKESSVTAGTWKRTCLHIWDRHDRLCRGRPHERERGSSPGKGPGGSRLFGR